MSLIGVPPRGPRPVHRWLEGPLDNGARSSSVPSRNRIPRAARGRRFAPKPKSRSSRAGADGGRGYGPRTDHRDRARGGCRIGTGRGLGRAFRVPSATFVIDKTSSVCPVVADGPGFLPRASAYLWSRFPFIWLGKSGQDGAARYGQARLVGRGEGWHGVAWQGMSVPGRPGLARWSGVVWLGLRRGATWHVGRGRDGRASPGWAGQG